MVFPRNLNEDPEARRDYREEWFEIAEEEQMDEGDISTSETTDGRYNPTANIDDEDFLDADDLIVEDEDEDLGFSFDEDDDYLDEDDDEDEDDWDEDDDLIR